MHDDQLMDTLLTEAMAADEPRLSPGFDNKVMRAVRPRRLGATGRVVMTGYAVTAVAATVWFMSSLPLTAVAASIAITVLVAVGLGVYGRRLAFGG
jgi:hypothetical protein